MFEASSSRNASPCTRELNYTTAWVTAMTTQHGMHEKAERHTFYVSYSFTPTSSDLTNRTPQRLPAVTIWRTVNVQADMGSPWVCQTPAV